MRRRQRMWLPLVAALLLVGARADSSSSSSSSSSSEDEDDGGNCGHGGGAFASARLGAQSVLLDNLENRIKSLKKAIEEASDDGAEERHIVDVEAMLYEGEKHDCEGKFLCDCGSCIDQGLTCDETPDCPDGSDEAAGHCRNLVEAGAVFAGHVDWKAGDKRSDGDVKLTITGNTQVDYFPGEVEVSALATFKGKKHGRVSEHTFKGAGFFTKGMRHLSLKPLSGEHVSFECNFHRDNVADCSLLSSTAATELASVHLVRK